MACPRDGPPVAELRTDDIPKAYRRAWELRDREPERKRLAAAAAYHGPDRADQRAAVETCRALVALEPGNPAARHPV